MRLFFLTQTHFDLENVMHRAKISQQDARSNTRPLNEIGPIKPVFSQKK